MDTSPPTAPRSQSPFFTIPFRLPRTRSADNLSPAAAWGGTPVVLSHSPLLDVIHRVEHFSETHPDWGPFKHHHDVATASGPSDFAQCTSVNPGTSPSLHVISPSPTTAAALPRSRTPFTLPHLVLPRSASPTPPLTKVPRVSSSSSLDAIPFTTPSKHGDGLTTASPVRSPAPSSPTPSQDPIHQGGAPVVYESVAVATTSHSAPPLCAHCGSAVTLGRPHHHPLVPSPLHSTTVSATGGQSTDKKPRPLMQMMVETCKNCMDRVSETAVRGMHREMDTPGRTPFVNFRQ